MEKLLVDGSILFLGSFGEMFFFGIILCLLYNKEFSIKQNLLFGIIGPFFIALLKLILPTNLSIITSIIAFLSFIPLSYYVLNLSLLKSVLSVVLYLVIATPLEIISSLVAFHVLKLNTNTDNIINSIQVFLFINLAFALVSLLIYLFKKHIRTFQFNFVKNKLLYLNILSILIVIAPNIFFFTLSKYSYPMYVFIYNLFAYVFLVILVMYNTYKNSQLEIKEIELKNSELHNKNLTTLIDSVRGFKHDYNNVVHAIGGYISLNDMDGLKKYYSGLIKDSQKVNQLECISPTKINESSVYGIIASKYQICDLKGITFTFESMFDFSKLSMPIYDFCKILGILLDNAIEAAEETKEKKINICVRESYKDKLQIFTIENSYNDKEIDIDKIYEKDFSTKKRNSGIGLWEVKNIIKKNANTDLITTKDENYFSQQLLVSSN